MAYIKFSDNALTTLASSISDSATQLTVATGDGANFPTAGGGEGYFILTLEDGAGNREYIKCDYRSGDIFGDGSYPLERGYAGSTAQAWSAGVSVDLRWHKPAVDAKDDEAVDLFAPIFGQKHSTTTGSTFGYYGGQLLVDGALTTIADGTVALTTANTNYVERTAAGVVSANTTSFSANKIPLYEVTVGASKITAVQDRRSLNEPLHGYAAKSVAGGAGTTTLTAAESRPLILEFTGVLTGNRVIELPNIKREWVVYNNTSGSYTLTVKVTGQTGVAVTQGKRTIVYGDGTDIRSAITDNSLIVGVVPSGGIIMWSGTVATIPSGWYLCDGSNSTPDLRDKFIIGARADDGGAAKTNVTGAYTQTGGSKDAVNVSHSHTFSGTTSGQSADHTHAGASDGDPYSGTGAYAVPYGGSDGGSFNTGGTSNDHTHTYSGSTSTDGSSGTNANLVPYYALAFIMKA